MPDPKIAQIEEYLQHAKAKMMQAEFANTEGKEQLYLEAADLLFRSERLMKGSGAWLMSCIHARRGNGKICVQWLERGRSVSMLPDGETIRAHPHFGKAKEKRWFKDWLNERG